MSDAGVVDKPTGPHTTTQFFIIMHHIIMYLYIGVKYKFGPLYTFDIAYFDPHFLSQISLQTFVSVSNRGKH